jgi:hypothetical protein
VPYEGGGFMIKFFENDTSLPLNLLKYNTIIMTKLGHDSPWPTLSYLPDPNMEISDKMAIPLHDLTGAHNVLKIRDGMCALAANEWQESPDSPSLDVTNWN